ncbi:MAG: PilZ domain-containing protein [Fibrobacter sp.]|nr:PilZ domain-containing protein [Fibrobacter sp.]
MNILERRNFPRIDVDYVTVEVYATDIKTHQTLHVEEICPVINLSENGMRFKAEHSFSTGQLLRLTFVLPDSIVIIRTNAIVVHYLKKSRKAGETGVQFKDLGISEQKLIRHFINKTISAAE